MIKSAYYFCLFFVFLIGSFTNLNAQEVKLGLPVGHTDGVRTVVFSPDGKTMLTASDDKTAKIWDIESGKLLQSLVGDDFFISSAVYSPDSKTVLIASHGASVKIWDIESGRLIKNLWGHSDAVMSAVFSPNGKTIVTASYDRSAVIWDVASGTLLHRLEGHTNAINGAKFSPDGRIILTSSNDNTARIWEVSSGKLLQSLEGHTNEVNLAEFSPDGKTVLTASKDGSARIWDVISGNQTHLLGDHFGEINSAVYSPNGKTALTLSYEKANFWDMESGKIILKLEGNREFFSIVYSPDGKSVLTVSHDKIARVWDSENGNLLFSFKDLSRILSAIFSPDGSKVLTTSQDGSVKIWDLSTGNLHIRIGGHVDEISIVDYNPNGKNVLITSKSNNVIEIWDVMVGKHLNSLTGHSNEVKTSVFGPDGKTILTASYDKTTKIWDAENGKLIQSFEHDHLVEYALFNFDGKTVITGNGLESTKIWDVKSGEKLKSIFWPHLGYNVDFSPSRKKIIYSGFSEIAKIWDIESQELLYLEGHTKYVNCVVFSPDEKTVLTGSRDKTAKIWEVSSGKLLHTLNGHNDEVISANYGPNSKVLLTVSKDTVKIWDVETGKFIRNLVGHFANINTAIFSPDEKHIITTSDDGSFILWNSQTGQQLIRHFIFDSDPTKWVHIHPSGLFDASPEAMELMYWTKGLEVIEFAQLKDRYWVPGLWEKVMKGEPLPDVRNMNELKLQPEVELGEIKDGKILVTITKREGGYGKVSILINGKEVQADARGTNFDKTKGTQTIYVDLKDHPNLQDGENTIAVKASSEDGFVTGRPQEKKVTMSIKKPIPHFYAVVVGTGKYTNSSINLKFPEKDATSMSTALQLGSEQLFGKDNTHIYTLTTEGTERPTKEKIKAVFEEIGTKASSSDVVLVYLSGHGIAWGGDQGDFYYVTTEATAASAEAFNDEAIRKNYTISTTEFTDYLKNIPALKQVMIIDACSSGKAVDNLLAARDFDASQIKAIDRMKDRTGMFVISGSAADAVSYEASRYGQGLLTFSILQAMKGASLRDGEFFDVNMILNYARENVPKLAAGIGGIQTPQLLIPKGGSFDIGQVTEASKQMIPLSTIKPVFVRSNLMNIDELEDNLGLGKLIDDQLNEIAQRGKNAEIVFIDSREFPDAYRLSGTYTMSNGIISLKLKIKGPVESEQTMTAATKEELVEQIVSIVEGVE